VADQPLYWVVVRDGKGKWQTVYDPSYKIETKQRFAFQAYADEHKKQLAKKDALAKAALAAKQQELS